MHPVAAAQFEYAPFTLEIEDQSVGIFKACKELNIALIAYSPLGRGLLSGKIVSERLHWRHVPRYADDDVDTRGGAPTTSTRTTFVVKDSSQSKPYRTGSWSFD